MPIDPNPTIRTSSSPGTLASAPVRLLQFADAELHRTQSQEFRSRAITRSLSR